MAEPGHRPRRALRPLRRAAELAVAVWLLVGGAWLRAERPPAVDPGGPAAGPAFPEGGTAPRLLVFLVVDQLPFSVFEWLIADRPDGTLAHLARHGTVMRARYGHATTLTAPGHAALASGAYAGRSGIVGTFWWDRAIRRHVYSVFDPSKPIVPSENEPGDGRGPRFLKVETLSDVLTRQTRGRGVSVVLSLKDRSAILSAGRKARAVLWYSPKEGAFVTSEAYRTPLPPWATRMNTRLVEAWDKPRVWRPLRARPQRFERRLPRTKRPGRAEQEAFLSSRFAQEALFELARTALPIEHLGEDAVPDLLVVAASTTDVVSHQHGAGSPERKDMLRHLDEELGRLLAAVEARTGKGRYTVAISSDHGGAGIEGAAAAPRVSAAELQTQVRQALRLALGKPPDSEWLEAVALPHLYFNRALLEGSPERYRQAVEVATRVVRGLTGVYAVFDRRALLSGQGPADPLALSVLRSLDVDTQRAGDLYVVFARGRQEPPGLDGHPSPSSAPHGSPWRDDTDVPFLLYGARVRSLPAGGGARLVPVAAIAPTLAALIGMPPPSAAESTPLFDVVLP
jgi:hypothetical protein